MDCDRMEIGSERVVLLLTSQTFQHVEKEFGNGQGGLKTRWKGQQHSRLGKKSRFPQREVEVQSDVIHVVCKRTRHVLGKLYREVGYTACVGEGARVILKDFPVLGRDYMLAISADGKPTLSDTVSVSLRPQCAYGHQAHAPPQLTRPLPLPVLVESTAAEEQNLILDGLCVPVQLSAAHNLVVFWSEKTLAKKLREQKNKDLDNIFADVVRSFLTVHDDAGDPVEETFDNLVEMYDCLNYGSDPDDEITYPNVVLTVREYERVAWKQKLLMICCQVADGISKGHAPERWDKMHTLLTRLCQQDGVAQELAGLRCGDLSFFQLMCPFFPCAALYLLQNCPNSIPAAVLNQVCSVKYKLELPPGHFISPVTMFNHPFYNASAKQCTNYREEVRAIFRIVFNKKFEKLDINMLNQVAVHQDPFRSQNTVLLTLIKYELADLATRLLDKFGDQLSLHMLNAAEDCCMAPGAGILTRTRAYYLSRKAGFREVWRVLESLGCDTEVRSEGSEDMDGDYEFSYWKRVDRESYMYYLPMYYDSSDASEDEEEEEPFDFEEHERISRYLHKCERLGDHSNW